MFLTLINSARVPAKALVIALSLLTCIQPLRAQTSLGTEITYSRSGMKINGTLLNGTFDFQFKLFDAPAGGNLVGPAITRNNIAGNNGVLKAHLLDFGACTRMVESVVTTRPNAKPDA